MGETLGLPRLLIAEGKDEVNAAEAVRDALGVAGIDIRSFDGNSNLRGYLKALRAVAGFDQLIALGIVRDAEGNAQAALQNVRDGLLAAGFPVPGAGLVLTAGKPQTIILVNPHGLAAGSLDDVCLAAVQDHQAMPCVNQYFECLLQHGVVPGANVAKARAHAFIASRERPDVSLGVAVKRGYFPLGHATFDPLRQVIRALGEAQ